MNTRSRSELLTAEEQVTSIVRTLADYAEMTKPRIVGLVGIATLGGFYLGSVGPIDIPLLCHALIGTVLLGCGANALNMYLERHSDRLMRRTENRPLPADRLKPISAFRFGMVSWLGGFAYLALFTNWVTAFIGWSTVILYLFAYTPLKKKSVLSTLVGAIPGALPPLIGWTAAGGGLNVQALSLFSILFFWQLPHFMAIAFMYREDYAR
ncbi:MAG: heme o synthase, partial [Candidatus Omnitrophica bacterium]|nr:heme o synthase [Candidatus Omnitrophota bacterium]